MRAWRRCDLKICKRLVEIDPVPRQKFAKILAIDDRQGVKPIDAGNYTFSFEVGESTDRDLVLFIVTPARDLLARRLNVAHRET